MPYDCVARYGLWNVTRVSKREILSVGKFNEKSGTEGRLLDV